LREELILPTLKDFLFYLVIIHPELEEFIGYGKNDGTSEEANEARV
jgi:hypothetical protein